MKFLQIVLLINLMFAGTALYLSIPTPHLQKCIMFQYDLTPLKASMDNGKTFQDTLLSTSRILCININPEDN